MGAKVSSANNEERATSRMRTYSETISNDAAIENDNMLERSQSVSHDVSSLQAETSNAVSSNSANAIQPRSDRRLNFSLGFVGRIFQSNSNPVSTHVWALDVLKCPVCYKMVQPDDIEYHIVICLTKPLLVYNDDILAEDSGECIICFDEMKVGNHIARLPCFCIYHKKCIDEWFAKNRSCPVHPEA